MQRNAIDFAPIALQVQKKIRKTFVAIIIYICCICKFVVLTLDSF